MGDGELKAVVNQSQLDPADEALLNKVADHIVRRGLSVPAVFFLESSKPMSYVGSQTLVFLEPFVRAFLSHESYGRFAHLLEDRENFERLIEVIEARDAAFEDEKRAAKRARQEHRASEKKGDGTEGPRRPGAWRRWFSRSRD